MCGVDWRMWDLGCRGLISELGSSVHGLKDVMLPGPHGAGSKCLHRISSGLQALPTGIGGPGSAGDGLNPRISCR